jgi:hypothetical protein
VGPETRRVLREILNFDFEDVARTAGGSTVFIQPDGTEVVWRPSPATE